MVTNDLYDEDDDMEVADPDDQADQRNLPDYDDFYDEEDDDADYEYFDLEDATSADIDFHVALYREEGEAQVVQLGVDLANDLEELLEQLRRFPGNAGATSVTSIGQDFFVICRVRGNHVQVFLSDAGAASDWPLAHDVVEYFDADIPGEDEDLEPVGDFDILADQGVDDFTLTTMAENLDEDPDVIAAAIIEKINFGKEFAKTVNWSRN